ncbi:MAG: SigE family RNA polymerase sigma factor [Micromonosporaceae bacterium]|nr:SigE family RNA polymerase sigma factor [Micromonosporaceae bacterium]
MAEDLSAFREYAAGRLDRLRRTAYLLCGDWHAADDLASTVLVKLLRHWRRISTVDDLDGYVRRMLLRAWLDERRRPWRREHPTAELPEPAAPADPGGRDDGGVVNRVTLVTHLAMLPPRRRAVLVLRFFEDLSVEQTAEVLGCSTGTVKSQTARALETMRIRLAAADAPEN